MPATTTSKIKGVSNPEFDGVSLPTLRAWKRFWEDDDRVAASEEAQKALEDRPRDRHIRMIALEIGRREAARA